MKRKINFICSILLYRLLLDIVYLHSISPIYSYDKLECNYTYRSMIISWIILLGFTFLFSSFLKMKGYFIPNIMMMFFITRFVPFTSFIGCNIQTHDFIFWYCVYWFVFCLSARFVNLPPLPKVKKSSSFIQIITVIIILTIVFISGYYTHFRITLNLFDVYGIRMEAREYNISTILLYLWMAAGNMLPLLLIYNMKQRNKKMSIIIVMIVLLNFSINGTKSVLFKLLLCILMYLYIKRNQIKRFGYMASSFVFISLIVDFVQRGIGVLTDMIIRRAFYIPVLLDGLFFDYYKSHQPLYFIGKTEGFANTAFLIGDVYFNNPTMSANNGMFSDAITNLGLMGCFIMPLVLSLYLHVFAKSFDRANHQIVLFVALVMVYTFEGSFFTTALLTHGILLTCLTLFLMTAEMRNIKEIEELMPSSIKSKRKSF